MSDVADLKSPLRELALFAGAGGGILGGKLLGWQTVCAVEWEPYAACVLAARQNDGLLPPFPIWDDIQTFDGRPWRGIVDVVSGGFPCQDISAAGKGAGIDGERSGMWKHMARVIREVRPRFVFVENSPMLVSRGLGTVLGDLAAMGFDACWGVLGAADVGAPHQRDRIWIVAHSREIGRISSPPKQGMEGRFRPTIGCVDKEWWAAEPKQTPREAEPGMGSLVDGMASRMDELAALGNGQVPLCAAEAWRELSELLRSTQNP
jgi:DNA (cytosine-5)-methyltransferase 1